MAKNQYTQSIRGAPVRQKMGMILENKVVQKLKLEKNIFYKKWSPKLIFFKEFFQIEKIPSIFDIENWLWKYDFGTFWRTIIHCRIVLKKNPLSMLILGQKACILGPTIFKIPQPNWRYSTHHAFFQRGYKEVVRYEHFVVTMPV